MNEIIRPTDELPVSVLKPIISCLMNSLLLEMVFL